MHQVDENGQCIGWVVKGPQRKRKVGFYHFADSNIFRTEKVPEKASENIIFSSTY